MTDTTCSKTNLIEATIHLFLGTQAVLPTMRKRKSGVIVNISSGAGRFGYPSGSVYVSTKFAVEGLSKSMAYELEPFGTKVIIIEPGVIRTNIFNSIVLSSKSRIMVTIY